MIPSSETLHRVRRRVALAALFAVLALAVAGAHSGPLMDQAPTGPVDTACLAVLGAAAALALLPAGQQRVPGRLPLPALGRFAPALPPRTVAPPARAGPAELQVFLS